MEVSNNKKQQIKKEWLKLSKDGYFIQTEKYKCGTYNYLLVKGEKTNGSTRSQKYFLSYSVAKYLKSIGFHWRRQIENSVALNFNPKSNVPAQGEIIYFK